MITQAATDANAAAEQDQLRTKRVFVGLLASALGVDQTYTTADSVPASTPGQFSVANPDGTASVQGQPISNLNTPVAALSVSPGMLLVVGLVAWLALRKG